MLLICLICKYAHQKDLVEQLDGMYYICILLVSVGKGFVSILSDFLPLKLNISDKWGAYVGHRWLICGPAADCARDCPSETPQRARPHVHSP